MANILEKYGIKEVADVTFYDLKEHYPVLYLDTLKVSTIEQTAEQVDARGGKGNPRLVTWDYNKDITVTLEDALFSAKSMAVMFGSGKVDATSETIKRTASFVATAASSSGLPEYWPSLIDTTDNKWPTTGVTYYKADAASSTDVVDVSALESGKAYFAVYSPTANNISVIKINSDTFPGTYEVVGDTYARSEATGKDEFFQFIIPKAKMSAENTITLEAEGDPSVFNLNLTVLKLSGQPLMKLVKYDLGE